MRVIIFSFLALVILFGCGEKEEQVTSEQVRTVEILAIDQMKYVVRSGGELIDTAGTVKAGNGNTYVILESIQASPGEKLRIRLTAVSKLPAAAMSHNWILLKPNIDPSAFASEAIKAKDQNHIPGNRTDDIIAHTALASGGKSVETTFTVPEETGNYDYLCSFPGHFTGGMTGKLRVR